MVQWRRPASQSLIQGSNNVIKDQFLIPHSSALLPWEWLHIQPPSGCMMPMPSAFSSHDSKKTAPMCVQEPRKGLIASCGLSASWLVPEAALVADRL